MRKKRRPQKKRELLWKNIFLWLGVAGVLLVIPSEDAFFLATKHVERRESYIASIVERFPPPENVAKVEYTTFEKMKEESASSISAEDKHNRLATVNLKATAGTERPLAVLILPLAFTGKDIEKEE